MSGSMQRQTSREIERVQARALIEQSYEQGRALIANLVLESTCALTALEQHCIEIAPLGEARYKAIVDAYALGAAQRIARG